MTIISTGEQTPLEIANNHSYLLDEGEIVEIKTYYSVKKFKKANGEIIPLIKTL